MQSSSPPRFWRRRSFVSSAYSAGDGGSGGTVTKCKDGKVWDKKQQKCVTPKQGMLDDDSIYEAGRDLAMAGRYGEAIEVLGLAADKTDPRILNYLGYSHRKSGRIQVGLGYYQEALRINPDYTLVREYLGEAYIQLGDVARRRTSSARSRSAAAPAARNIPRCRNSWPTSTRSDRLRLGT